MVNERSLVARRIEQIREAKKISRRDLGILVGKLRGDDGLTYLQVYRIEKDEVDVSADLLASIAEVLDASVASFYRESRAAS